MVVLAEAGFIQDDRCRDALDLLESKQLPNGGFLSEVKYYRVTTNEFITRGTFADWGPGGTKKENEFVTAEALYVFKEAGRLNIGEG